MGNKLAGVEAARGVAALLVVLVHATSMLASEKYFGTQALGGLFKFGHAGVDFFFVLSGFIIYFIHHTELGQTSFLGAYWYKRFIRIFPIYWIVLFFYGLILLFSPTKDMFERIPEVILSAILLIPNIHGPILGVAWTLSHEFLFYAIFSSLFFSKWLGFIVLMTWFVLLLFNIVTNFFDGFLWGTVIFRIFNLGFFFGMAVAYLVLNYTVKLPKLLLWLGVILFFGAGVFESWGPGVPVEWPPLHLAYALGAACALYGLVGLEKSGRLKVPGVLVELGKASYSIYLVHVIFIMLLQQVLIRLKPWGLVPDALIFWAVVFTVTIAGTFFSKVVEQPLLSKLRPKRRHEYASTPR